MASPRLPLVLLLAGFLTTGIIVGSLLASRSQIDAGHAQLDRMDAELAVPLGLVDEVQAGLGRSQASFVAGTDEASPDAMGAHFSQALSDAEQAEADWAAFDSFPIRFPGEASARDAARTAMDASAAAGERMGVAVLATGSDPAELAVLGAAQEEAAAQGQSALQQLVTEFYRPALSQAQADLAEDQARASQILLLGVGVVVGVGVVMTLFGYRQMTKVARDSARRRERQEQIAAENALDAQLQQALDMAVTEEPVFRILDRAFTRNGGALTTDVLMASSATAAFRHVGELPDEEGRRCPVESPGECPVAKRGQVLVFDDSTALDACEHLHTRAPLVRAAVCVPVTITGSHLGVLHEASLDEHPQSAHRRRELEIIARKAGERLGMIRTFARSESQAQTDPLTGLLNRRRLEERVAELGVEDGPSVVVYADLDHFKDLNDTYGHDTGDRALRIFSEVLRTNVRPDDIVCRYGGEEFVVVLPKCTTEMAVSVLQRVQQVLADTLAADGCPPFTVSLGMATTHLGGSFDEALMIADECLMRAKNQGRNQIVVAGAADPYPGPTATVDPTTGPAGMPPRPTMPTG